MEGGGSEGGREETGAKELPNVQRTVKRTNRQLHIHALETVGLGKFAFYGEFLLIKCYIFKSRI